MRRVVLYIAMSLDGKIADAYGGVEWLEKIPVIEGEDYGYEEFYNSVDTVVMGNKTYEQVLSFDIPYPYSDKQSFIITSKKKKSYEPMITFVNENVPSFIRSLKAASGKDIWLIGGGEVNSYFLENQIIDEIICFVMPIVLGKGISLFGNSQLQQSLTLISTRSIKNGVVELRYKL